MSDKTFQYIRNQVTHNLRHIDTPPRSTDAPKKACVSKSFFYVSLTINNYFLVFCENQNRLPGVFIDNQLVF